MVASRAPSAVTFASPLWAFSLPFTVVWTSFISTATAADAGAPKRPELARVPAFSVDLESRDTSFAASMTASFCTLTVASTFATLTATGQPLSRGLPSPSTPIDTLVSAFAVTEPSSVPNAGLAFEGSAAMASRLAADRPAYTLPAISTLAWAIFTLMELIGARSIATPARALASSMGPAMVTFARIITSPLV